ncbi:hypothetical protein L209DRAFT_217014 [Thermothelomyces heterothallicus CBS 203.75]
MPWRDNLRVLHSDPSSNRIQQSRTPRDPRFSVSKQNHADWYHPSPTMPMPMPMSTLNARVISPQQASHANSPECDLRDMIFFFLPPSSPKKKNSSDQIYQASFLPSRSPSIHSIPCPPTLVLVSILLLLIICQSMFSKPPSLHSDAAVPWFQTDTALSIAIKAKPWGFVTLFQRLHPPQR